jgi:hypothetical protein
MPRQFPVPEGVYVGEVDGHKELYTRISPLPPPDSGDFLDEGFLPHPPAQKSDGNFLEDERPPGAAEPVLSSESPEEGSTGGEVEMIPLEGDFEGGTIEREGTGPVDPLHPPQRHPEEVGEDSGSLF